MKQASTSTSSSPPNNPHHVVPITDPPKRDPQVNHPSGDLVEGKGKWIVEGDAPSRKKYIEIAVPLYEAAMKGDWKAAKPILDENPDVLRYAITENYETLLHIAASAESNKGVEEFVTNLVKLMEKEDLELQNKNLHTAFNLAAAAGNIETVKIMVEKYGNVIEIETKTNTPPLYMAALFAKPEMVRYLYENSKKMTGDVWKDDNRSWVLQKCVEAEIFDVALSIVKDCPDVLSKNGVVTEVLIALAQNTKAFKVTKPSFISRIINSSDAPSRKKYIEIAVPLYEAAMKGDWKAAKPILDENPDVLRYAITENYETLLHIAASAESNKGVEEFVTNLVKLMEKEDLELQNKNLHTAFNLAAAAGNIETVKIMVEKYGNVIEIETKTNTPPLYMAALFAKPEMVRYLYENSKKMTGDVWKDDNRSWVLQKCVEAEIFDVALSIVKDCPDVLSKNGVVTEVLIALAQNTKAFKVTKPSFISRIINSISAFFYMRVGPDEKESEALQLLKIIWKEIVTRPKSEIDDIIRGPELKENNKSSTDERESEALQMLRTIWNEISIRPKIQIDGMKQEQPLKEKEKPLKEKNKRRFPSRVLFLAVKMGNTPFIIELIRLYPDLIWKQDDKGKTIFHLAAKRRKIKIYNLMYQIGAMKDLITPVKDENDNNMLHMVAKSVKQKRYQVVSGVAFQMQQELLWFKEVQQVIPPQYRKRKNKDGETPQDLFTRKHADLVKNGEEWMKDTASQCMVVATLIATIVFAAAFTLPGGYNQNIGIPFFRKQPSLIIFVISDAVSLVSSSTSILMFLSILTSRYAERDFLESLPKKLVNGLATLFLSIVTMMLAFSSSFFVLYKNKLEWVPITITGLAGIPVFLYVVLHYHLFWDVFRSAYRSKNLFKRNERALY